MMLVCGIGFANAQQLAVSGTVTDHTGEPLIGVTVTVSGTKTGADIDGKYSIQADAKGKLKFSYVGYDTLLRNP